MTEPSAPPEPPAEEAALEPVALPPEAEVVLPSGVQPSRNYVRAVELGHVLAASGLYKDARDPAKAAVKVMIGMDIGVSPTAAMQGIHVWEKDDRIVFLVEAKLLAGVIKARPDVEFEIVTRTDEKVEIKFKRRVEGKWRTEKPNIVWTVDRAKREVPDYAKKTKTWGTMPMVMMTWRALAEGIRLHFPDVIAGQPVYVDEEFDFDRDSGVQAALSPKAEPLTTDRAEELRSKAAEVYESLRQINATRMPPARFDAAIKGAEHSHERLEAVVASLEDLFETEKQVVDLTEKVNDALDKPDAKKAIESAERKGSNRERIDVLQAALDEVAVDAEVVDEEEPKPDAAE